MTYISRLQVILRMDKMCLSAIVRIIWSIGGACFSQIWFNEFYKQMNANLENDLCLNSFLVKNLQYFLNSEIF